MYIFTKIRSTFCVYIQKYRQTYCERAGVFNIRICLKQKLTCIFKEQNLQKRNNSFFNPQSRTKIPQKIWYNDLSKQWAALTIHWLDIKVPPQKWPLTSWKVTCHGHSPSTAGSPPTTLRFGLVLRSGSLVMRPHWSVPDTLTFIFMFTVAYSRIRPNFKLVQI